LNLMHGGVFLLILVSHRWLRGGGEGTVLEKHYRFSCVMLGRWLRQCGAGCQAFASHGGGRKSRSSNVGACTMDVNLSH